MTSRTIKRKFFEYEIHTRGGQSFQDFFASLIKKHFPSYTLIKPQGQYGDAKNDGYIPGEGSFFQVYAPEDPHNKSTVNNMAKKLETDFYGLYEQWNSLCTIKKFRYVINDKFKGIPTKCSMKMEELNLKQK